MYRKPDILPYNEIISNLYIGNHKALHYATKFNLIVNCTKCIPFPISMSIECIRVSINDNENESLSLLQYAPTVIERIHDALQHNKPVLVHCHAGIQRSCTIVAMYLMKYYDILPSYAIDFIRSKRSVAFHPTPTFDRALRTYYRDMSSL
jgi:protein-tyrosine phosphatase